MELLDQLFDGAELPFLFECLEAEQSHWGGGRGLQVFDAVLAERSKLVQLPKVWDAVLHHVSEGVWEGRCKVET